MGPEGGWEVLGVRVTQAKLGSRRQPPVPQVLVTHASVTLVRVSWKHRPKGKGPGSCPSWRGAPKCVVWSLLQAPPQAPADTQQGEVQPLWFNEEAVLRALSALYHSRLPTSHRGEPCHHLRLTNEAAAGLPTLPQPHEARAHGVKSSGSQRGRLCPPGKVWTHLWLSRPGARATGTK